MEDVPVLDNSWLYYLEAIIKWCWNLLCYPIQLGSYQFSLKNVMFFALSCYVISNIVLTFMDADDLS